MTNILIATFDGEQTTRTEALYQWDYGQVLRLADLELPELYEVDFASCGRSITMLGGPDGVDIPDELLMTGQTITAYVVLKAGEEDRETEYQALIPIIKRPQPTDIEPTPAQQTTIDRLIALMEATIAEARRVFNKAITINGEDEDNA